MRRLLIALILGLVTAGSLWWFFWFQEQRSIPQEVELSDSVSALLEQPIAEPIVVTSLKEPVEENPIEEKQEQRDNDNVVQTTIPYKAQLSVPFIVQAPFADWELPYKEACEEASIMMVHAFYEQDQIVNHDQMKSAIDSIIYWGDEEFGAFDTSAATSSQYFTKKLAYDPERIHVVYDMNIDDIKAVIAQGYPVIIPAAGRELGNKFFQTPGPLYHMLVITGYEGDEFITNDPGTRNGEGYRYNEQILYNAIHDLTEDLEAISTGRKAMIIVK